MDAGAEQTTKRRRATTYYGVGFVLLLLFNMLLQRGRGMQRGWIDGELAGATMTPAFIGLIVYGVALIFRKARTRAGGVRVAWWTQLVLFCLVFWMGPEGVVTASETEGLHASGDSLINVAVGFTLPLPEDRLRRAPDLEASTNALLAKERRMFAWVYATRLREQILLVQITKDLQPTEEAFRKFAAGLRGTADSMPGARVLLDTVIWADAGGEHRMSTQLGNGLLMQSRCIPTKGNNGDPFIVCVETLTKERDGLERSRAGLSQYPAAR